MDLSKIIELIIKEAIKKGQFENLPGTGKPLNLKNPNPFESQEERLFYKIMKSLGEVPIEVLLLKEIEMTKQALENSKIESEKEKLKQKLKELTLKYDIQMEARRSFFNK